VDTIGKQTLKLNNIIVSDSRKKLPAEEEMLAFKQLEYTVMAIRISDQMQGALESQRKMDQLQEVSCMLP
jgi:hypothetical protein